MRQFFDMANKVGNWIRSLPEDKHWHIIGNTMLASMVAIVMPSLEGWLIVAGLGVFYEVLQYRNGMALTKEKLIDSAWDIVANNFGAGMVFIPIYLT